MRRLRNTLFLLGFIFWHDVRLELSVSPLLRKVRSESNINWPGGIQ